MKPRTEGTVSLVGKPSGKLWEQAQAILNARAERRQALADKPVPNIVCYAKTAFKGWVPGMKLPHCKRCDARLEPNENHVCPVKLGTKEFKPKYVERDQDFHDRWEQRREEIKESRGRTYDYDGEPIVMCDVCGERMYDPEDAHDHFEDHGGKPEDTRHTRDSEPDGDLDGYEDEPEEDYCEGDDDGYDCD